MGYTAFQAEEYDAKIRQTLPFYDAFYEQIADILEAAGKRHISWLDIGCGTGKMYEVVEKRISAWETSGQSGRCLAAGVSERPAFQISKFVFSDISEKMLDAARSRFQSEGNHFQRMSVLELDEQEQYDVVTAVQVHHYLTEKERESAVRNCFRALKNGGFFFSFENIAPCSETGRQIFLNRWKQYQIRNGKDEEEAEGHMKRYGTEYFPITVEAHLDLMRRCGFSAVELVWTSYMQAGLMGIKISR